jgi:hypothetical protein
MIMHIKLERDMEETGIKIMARILSENTKVANTTIYLNWGPVNA